MRLAGALVLLLTVGCATVYRSPAPGPRATAWVQSLRRPDRETIWIVTVNNPTGEAVYIDCDEARIRIPPRVQTDVLLTPEDAQCDLKNDVEYGALPSRTRTAAWGPRTHWGCGP